MQPAFATLWYPSTDLSSTWLLIVGSVSTVSCFLASLRRIKFGRISQWLLIIGPPVLFGTVLFSETAMLVLKDGKDFGFPLWARSYPNATDFIATYFALGASYLIARQGMQSSNRIVRIAALIEAITFGLLAAMELALIARRLVAT